MVSKEKPAVADSIAPETPAVKTFSSLKPIADWSPELLQLLAERGIDPEAFDTEFRCVGIRSASGPAEFQAEIDAWIAAGGNPYSRVSKRRR